MLEVLACPLPTSVQDLGRPGYRHLGVPLSGALDSLGLRLANALVRNPPDAAALEMRLLGPRLKAHRRLRVALAYGAAVIERADGGQEILPAWRSALLAAGDVIAIGRIDGGAGYLAVSGGFATAEWLGSRSTYARAGLGEAPVPGMLLPVGDGDLAGPDLALLRPPVPPDPGPIRVIAGPQNEAFSEEAWTLFRSAVFTVGHAADRMGLRLEGPALAHRGGADVVSEAVTPGAIQVPGDGRPIVLLADCQSVGGYTKIAVVIQADLPRLGRLLPGAEVRFRPVTVDQALEALRAQEAWLAGILAGLCRWPPDQPDLGALYGNNLVDGVVYAR